MKTYHHKRPASPADIPRSREQQIAAEQNLQLFAKVFDNALEGIIITDEKANIIAVNQSFTNITGYQASQVLNKNPRILKSARHGADFYREMWRSIKEKGNWVGEIWNRRANGEAFPERLSISCIYDNKRKITNFVAVFHDITDSKLREEQIRHQAYHDALTVLPNRLLAMDRLHMALTKARHQGKNKYALFRAS